MRKSILVGLGLALSVAGTAIAQQSPDTLRGPRGERGADRGGRVEGRGGPDGFLLKGITLTEGQRTQIAQLRRAQRDQMDAGRETARGQNEALRTARQRGDTAAVRRMMEQRRQAMERQRTQHVAAIRNLLTAEQRVQFDRNVAELAQRGPGTRDGEMRGKRGARGRGPGGQPSAKSNG